MKRTLAHALRPKRLSQLIGQDSLVATIRNQYSSGREPAAWLFVGPTGTGKTSVARILAISLQCTHAEFGEPCDECLAKTKDFSIHEINASEVSGVNEIREIAKGSLYQPLPPSRRSVFLLDEAQRLSKDAQNLSLKYLEDAPESTAWIVGTSEENKLLPAIIRRCERQKLKLLQADDITRLVKRALKFVKSTKPVDPIVNSLWEAKIQSSGLILNAVELYLSGQTAKAAVESIGFGADTLAICRSLEKGDWDAIKKETKEATSDDLRGIRAQVAGYLRRCLERAVPGPRSGEFAKAISRVAQVDSYTDATQGPATVAVLYELCQIFAGPIDDIDDPDEVKRDD
jgi:replication-associated recombination protein RarA